MITASVRHLAGLLGSHIPLSVLKPEYAQVLHGKSVLVNEEKSISHLNLAEFMLSSHKEAIDKNKQYMVQPSATTSTEHYEEQNPKYKD